MQVKFKEGQSVRIVGKDVPPETKYKIGVIREIEPEHAVSRPRYIIRLKGSDRYFYEDELEEIK